MLNNRPQNAILRYGLAISSVCAATVATHLLRGVGDMGISPLFFAAVLFTAWYGGLGAGLLATFLSSIASGFLLLRERGASVAAIPEHILRLMVFSVVSVITSSLHGALRSAADASKRAKEAAEAASESKSRFIAMVSHELRTPLNPVLMLTQLMEKDPALAPGMRNDVRTIRRNVDLELRLIDDLVDLTRINTGKMNLHEDLVDVYDALNAAIEVCRDDVRENQLDLVTHFDAAYSTVKGDSVRLQQVFWNLIRNAVKFTPEGGVIHIYADNSVTGAIVIRISDTGIGIDSDRLRSIFHAFEQGGPDIQTRFGGLGLGLAICQAMVEAHHGVISAASEGKGKGATFSVTLALIKQPAAAIASDVNESSTLRTPSAKASTSLGRPGSGGSTG